MILLAAGYGTRLRPLTNIVPKCLVEISGKPLLAHWLDAANASHSVDEIMINTHYLSQQVADFVRAYASPKPVHLVHEERLLGTAGTVRAHLNWLANDPFVLVHADNFSALRIDDLINAHSARPPDCVITMLAFRTDTPETCGILKLDKQCRVVSFFEKSQEDHGNLANGAVYVCTPEVATFIRCLDKPEPCFSDDVIPRFIGQIYCHEIDGHHIDIGNFPALEKAKSIRLPQWGRHS